MLIFGEITGLKFCQGKARSRAWQFIATQASDVVLTPVNMFSAWRKWLLRKLFKNRKTSTITEGELLTIVETAENEGELQQHESQLIRSAIEFEDLDVKDIMIPRVTGRRG